jgi:hypothetical protein
LIVISGRIQKAAWKNVLQGAAEPLESRILEDKEPPAVWPCRFVRDQEAQGDAADEDDLIQERSKFADGVF